MPFLSKSTYQAPFLFQNVHLNTIYPALFRTVKDVQYFRERIETPDNDFFDIDWSKTNNNRLMICKHGLEGDSSRSYVKGMVRAFNQEGWDAAAFNFRGCSGEHNRQPQSYHMGWWHDLDFFLKKLEADAYYKEVVLVGFSLGGSTILNYLGQHPEKVPSIVKKAVAFSVPVHIPSTNIGFNSPKNYIYLKRFMRNLNAKTLEKSKVHPDVLKIDPKNLPKNFDEFDELITGPVHGFENGMDYWVRCSAKQYLQQIEIPTLLVNSEDDTFLSDECYPIEIAKQSKNFFFEMPKYGGHVGFMTFGGGNYWSEERALEFVREA